jgi:hypothetical protein
VVATERLHTDAETCRDNRTGSLRLPVWRPQLGTTRTALRQEDLTGSHGKVHTGRIMASPRADFQGDAIYVDTNVLWGWSLPTLSTATSGTPG